MLPSDSIREILKLVCKPELKVLQFSEVLSQSVFDALNEDFFPKRPDVQLRVFGFYGKVCDLSFCSRIPNVRRFAADCLQEARGVEHIASLPSLETLIVGIRSLDSFTFLNDLNPTLAELTLSDTKSRKHDLSVLSRFSKLQRLFLSGQQKNIEVLSSLLSLEDLTLSSVTLPSLSFISTLPKLWSLDIKLGGTKNISALEGLTKLKYLELWQVRGLSDISVICSLTGLQHLFLQSLLHISSLPPLHHLCNLRRITLDTMKGLTDISALSSAPVLQEVVHIAAGVPPEAYLVVLQKPSLKAVHAGFGSLAKNERFRQLCEQNGIRFGHMDPFVFL